VDVELEAEAEVQTLPIFAVQTTPHGLKEVLECPFKCHHSKKE
jgi:hypothetical protein